MILTVSAMLSHSVMSQPTPLTAALQHLLTPHRRRPAVNGFSTLRTLTQWQCDSLTDKLWHFDWQCAMIVVICRTSMMIKRLIFFQATTHLSTPKGWKASWCWGAALCHLALFVSLNRHGVIEAVYSWDVNQAWCPVVSDERCEPGVTWWLPLPHSAVIACLMLS